MRITFNTICGFIGLHLWISNETKCFDIFGQNLETPATVWWWQVVEEGGNSLESCRMRGL